MSQYWLHYSQSAKWSHRSRTQTCTVVFFERSNMWPNPSFSHALTPASALLSAVHFSMCGSAPGSGFSELLLGAVRSSRQCVWARASAGAPKGWLPGWRCVGSRAFTPAFIHVVLRAVPTSVEAARRRPLLTSSLALSAHRWPGTWNGISDVCYETLHCAKHQC